MRPVLLLTFAVLALAACDSGMDDDTGDPCPAGPSDGEVDFLPLKAGDVWVFEYSATSWVIAQPSTSERGTFTLTLADPSCEAETRTVEASEHRRGIRMSSYTRADGVTVRDTVSFDEVRDVVLVETAEGVQLPWSSGAVARYHPTAEDTVRVPAGPYGPVCGPGAAIATLTSGGLVEFSAACNHVSSGSSLNLVRLRVAHNQRINPVTPLVGVFTLHKRCDYVA